MTIPAKLQSVGGLGSFLGPAYKRSHSQHPSGRRLGLRHACYPEDDVNRDDREKDWIGGGN